MILAPSFAAAATLGLFAAASTCFAEPLTDNGTAPIDSPTPSEQLNEGATEASPGEPPATDNSTEATIDEPTTDDAANSVDEATEAATEKDAEMIRRNELLAEIDERYAAPKPSSEQVVAPVKTPNLALTIGVSLGLGFLGLLAATFIVLRPL